VTNEKKELFWEENQKRTYGEEREVTHSGYSIIVDEQKSCFDKKKLGVGQMLKIFKRFPQGVYC
jgi:hypothetical protein